MLICCSGRKKCSRTLTFCIFGGRGVVGGGGGVQECLQRADVTF